MEQVEERRSTLSNERASPEREMSKQKSLLGLVQQIQSNAQEGATGVFSNVRKNTFFSFESYSPERVQHMLSNKPCTSITKRKNKFIAQNFKKMARYVPPTDMIKKLRHQREVLASQQQAG